MKQTLCIICFLLLTYMLSGQDDVDSTNIADTDTISTNNPTFVFMLRKGPITLESEAINQVDPNHVKRIEVIKAGEIPEVYDAKDGVVFVYPKWRFRHCYRKMFTKEKNNGT